MELTWSQKVNAMHIVFMITLLKPFDPFPHPNSTEPICIRIVSDQRLTKQHIDSYFIKKYSGLPT